METEKKKPHKVDATFVKYHDAGLSEFQGCSLWPKCEMMFFSLWFTLKIVWNSGIGASLCHNSYSRVKPPGVRVSKNGKKLKGWFSQMHFQMTFDTFKGKSCSKPGIWWFILNRHEKTHPDSNKGFLKCYIMRFSVTYAKLLFLYLPLRNKDLTRPS